MLLPKLPRPANDLIPTVVWFLMPSCFYFTRVGYPIFVSLPHVLLSIEMSDVLVGIRQ